MNNKRNGKPVVFRPWVQGLSFVLAITAMTISNAGTIQAKASPADEAFLQRLAGSWKGKGSLRPNSTAKVEPVSCRMSASWSGGNKSLSVSMNCKGVDVNFSSSGVLQSTDRANAFGGRWSGALGIGSANVVGYRNGNALSVTIVHTSDSGKPIRSTMYLQLSGNGRALSNSVSSQDKKNGRNFQVLSLSMRK